jgi:hypothetical protein
MKQSQTATPKQAINAKVAKAKAAAAGKVSAAQKKDTVTRIKTVVDPKRVAQAQTAIEAEFGAGNLLNTCNTIKHLTRQGFKPLEIIAATGFNKVTVYRQSAEAHFAPVNAHE